MQNQILESAFAAHRATLMKNVRVKPIEGTVVDEMLKTAPASYKDVDQSVNTAINSDAYDSVQTAVTNVTEHLSSYQDYYESSTRVAIEQKAAEVSQIVLAHLNFVKDVANPICKDFVQSYGELTQEPHDPCNDFNIIKVKANPVLSNSTWISSMLQEYDNPVGEKRQFPTGHFPLPVMTFSQVCEAIVRYYGDNGAEIFEYLQSLGTDPVMDMLGSQFNWPQSGNKLPLPNPRDNDTIMFLFANAMYDNPVQGTEHTLGNFNDRMKSYVISCGYALCKFHIKDYMNQIANAQVINRINGFNIFLNETNYDAFIKEGGDDIKLLGFVVSKEHVALSTIKELKEHSAVYDNAWAKYVVNKKSEYDSKASARARQVYLFLAEKIIKDNKDALEQFAKDINVQVDLIVGEYYRQVKINQRDYPDHMLSEPQRMAMELMGYLFPGSSVKTIYSMSLDVQMLNPEYSSQEIWQVTAYKYICKFYFDQLLVFRKQ